MLSKLTHGDRTTLGGKYTKEKMSVCDYHTDTPAKMFCDK